jgi:hypothetical protein
MTDSLYSSPCANARDASHNRLIEPPVYLPAMMDEFRIAGSKVEARELRDPAEVAGLS